MSMIASDVATIPAEGFSWYVLFLEDAFDDPLKTQLSANFLTLGREVGRDVLVVRGFDPSEFFKSAYETVTLYDPEWTDRLRRPGILVSDTAPRLLLSEPAKLRAAKLIYMPLASFRERPSASLSDLLRQLVAALRDPDADRALSGLEPGAFSRVWGWLARFVELKPNFMGFGVNLNEMLDRVARPTTGT